MIVKLTDKPEKMSCNGCRVLRKGCGEYCILRPCLQWIEGAEAQAHATVFVAKFFGRAGLMSFISAVPESQRPGLFQSLLYEACGRTVNPVYGAVGLLSTGNWHVCQGAAEIVLRGGKPRPLPEADILSPESDAQYTVLEEKHRNSYGQAWCSKTSKGFDDDVARSQLCDLDLGLKLGYGAATVPEKLRPATPSFNSEGSVTTSFDSAGDSFLGGRKVLNLLF